MKIAITFNKVESNELVNRFAEAAHKIDKAETGRRLQREWDDGVTEETTKHFTGGVVNARVKDGAMIIKLSYDEKYICGLLKLAVMAAEKLYPVYNTIKGITGMFKGTVNELNKEYNNTIAPFKPVITSTKIRFYKNEDLGIYITFQESVNNFSETRRNHWHCLHNDSGLDGCDVHKLTKAKNADKFIITVREIKDPEALKDEKYILDTQELVDKEIWRDLNADKHSNTTEETDEDDMD